MRIRGFFIEGNLISLLYDHCEIGTLRNLMYKNKSGAGQGNSLNNELKINIVYEVALGLKYLHSQNPPIIHGHLHPNNMLVIIQFQDKLNVKNSLMEAIKSKLPTMDLII